MRTCVQTRAQRRLTGPEVPGYSLTVGNAGQTPPVPRPGCGSDRISPPDTPWTGPEHPESLGQETCRGPSDASRTPPGPGTQAWGSERLRMALRAFQKAMTGGINSPSGAGPGTRSVLFDHQVPVHGRGFCPVRPDPHPLLILPWTCWTYPSVWGWLRAPLKGVPPTPTTHIRRVSVRPGPLRPDRPVRPSGGKVSSQQQELRVANLAERPESIVVARVIGHLGLLDRQVLDSWCCWLIPPARETPLTGAPLRGLSAEGLIEHLLDADEPVILKYRLSKVQWINGSWTLFIDDALHPRRSCGPFSDIIAYYIFC